MSKNSTVDVFANKNEKQDDQFQSSGFPHILTQNADYHRAAEAPINGNEISMD
jgi:hypothetical protein